MPGQRVSWQVTGIRQDAFANANRIPVEEVKSDSERGKYLHPEARGRRPEKGVGWAKRLELDRLGSRPDLPEPVAIRAGNPK